VSIKLKSHIGENDKKIAVAYIRVSTQDQTEYSPDSQLKLIKAYAENHNMILDEVYSDEGISGRKVDKRPAFKRMIVDASMKKFDTIIIYNTSRFARNHVESAIYTDIFKRYGVQIVSITQPPIDYKTDILMNAIYAAMDERYSIELSENVKRGMIEKASRGIYISCAPLGYVRKESKKPLVIHEFESQLIKWIFNEYENGNTMFAISKELNNKGHRAKRGNPFDRRGIHRILSNPVYKGFMLWRCDGKEINMKADHEPIISETQFDKVQDKLKDNLNKRAWKSKDSAVCSHWLSGLIRCQACGTTYVYLKGYNGRADRFRCGRYGNASCKNNHSVKVSDMESLVIQHLETVMPGRTQFVKVEKEDSPLENQNENNIKQLETSLERAKSAFLRGIDTLDEYGANKITITAEINRLKVLNSPKQPKLLDKAAFKERTTGLVEILRSDRDNTVKNEEIKKNIQKIVPDLITNTFTFYFFEY